MKTRAIALFFSLILLFWVGGPFAVNAEKPAPPPEATPTVEVSDALETVAGPVFIADQLLGAPNPPSGCTTNVYGFESVTSTPIEDAGVITSTLTIDGLDDYLWDLNLTTYIEHTYAADLDIFLTSPAGTEVSLTTDNGGSSDNVFNGTVWDDQWVGSSVGDYTYVNNVPVPTMSPEEALGAFIGEDPNGTWTLTIYDDLGGDVGALNGWHLQITTLPATPQFIGTYSTSGNPTTPIPDGDTLITTIPFNVQPLIFSNLELTLKLNHTHSADLDVYLVSPGDLITVTLTSDNGSDLNNVFGNTIWSDQAGDTNPPGAVSDTTFDDGVAETALVPENAMSAFIGQNLSGTWKVIIVDDDGGETGTYLGYTLKVNLQSCLPDLDVNQISNAYPTHTNEPIEYNIMVQNDGSTLAQNVLLTDTLPSGMAFQSWTAALGWTCETPAVGQSGQITCAASELAPLTTITHTLNLVPVNAPQPIPDNIVVVSTSDPESIEYNNSDGYEHWVVYQSANGNYWDLQDALFYWATNASNLPIDDGGLEDGGQDAFDSWGMLQVRILDESNTILTDNQPLEDFDLTFVGDGWESHNHPSYSGIAIQRTIYAPQTVNYLRYLDTFTNNSTHVRHIRVAWGGDLGSDSGTTIAATASGDLTLDSSDPWAVTIEEGSHNPAGPAGDPPVGYLLYGSGDTSYQGTGDSNVNPFETAWSGNGNEYLAHVYAFTLQPGETKHLLYFVYRGLAEETEGPEYCTTNCVTPPAGTEIALAQTVLTTLAATPDVCDLPEALFPELVNWPELNVTCPVISYPLFLPLITR
ncbi:MAG: proprotein convertase P-domain-containing protein [Anaerolineales bacterium]|nr:proprotein convertase P-domain-containing protein [Anaerolineales bacterium]